MLYTTIYIICKKKKFSPNRYHLFIVFLLFLPGFLIPFYYAHIFDDSLWYYEYRSVNNIEYILILLAPFMVLLSLTLVNIKYILISLLPILIFIPYAKIFLSPIDLSYIKNKVLDGVTIQTTSSSCGPSAVASLLRLRGIEKTEKEIVISCNTTRTGTEIWNIKKYLQSINIDSSFIIDKKILPPYPSIAGIKLGNGMGHFIAILDLKDGEYIIGDSISGKNYIDSTMIKDEINFTGFYLKLLD